MSLALTFGAFAAPLKKQLRGHRVPSKDVAHFQADADAITRLGIRGLLSDAEKRRARQRLIDRIAKAVPQSAPPAERT